MVGTWGRWVGPACWEASPVSGPIPELGKEEEGAMKEVAIRQVQRPKKEKGGGHRRVGLTWHQLGGNPQGPALGVGSCGRGDPESPSGPF